MSSTLSHSLAALCSQAPPEIHPHLKALEREPDSHLWGQGLYALASQAEARGDMSFAAAAYRQLVEGQGDIGRESALAQRARLRLESLGGEGTFGERAERFLRQIVSETLDPGLLLGMGAAAGVFRISRLLALAKLGAMPGLSATTGALLANISGYALEAPAFALANRGARVIFHLPEVAAFDSPGRELLSNYLFLGAMRLAGGATARLVAPMKGESLPFLEKVSVRWLPQASALGGVMLSRRLEYSLGLRPEEDFAASLGSSLATLIHLNVAGQIFHRLSGQRFRRWERAMDLRSASAGFAWNGAWSGKLQPLLSSGNSLGDGRGTLEPMRNDRGANEALPKKSGELPATGKWEPGFGKQVANWGYDWQEGKMKEYAPDFFRLRELDAKVSARLELEPSETDYLARLTERVRDDLKSFEGSRRKLASLVESSRKDGVRQSAAEEKLVDRVLHDLNHRSQFLHVMIVAVEALGSGHPLADFFWHSLDPKAGFPLDQTIREGIVMASSESTEIVRRVGASLRGWDFHDVQLAQGSVAARGFGDILANFLTNAWRYRRGDDVAVKLEPRFLPGGAFQFSISDEGIGIEAANLVSLGSHGFREARLDLSRSHGFGLASVIASLRVLGWGPLWVRSRVGEGSTFRFEIPAKHLFDSEPKPAGEAAPSVDPVGQGPETSLEVNLREGFMVPAASLDLAIDQLLTVSPVPDLMESFKGFPGGSIQALRTGALRHRRLEIFHRLLAGNRSLEDLRVLENGHGGYQPMPSDVVYWANPDFYQLHRALVEPIGDYLGRDVAPGGYLVLQSSEAFGLFHHLKALKLTPDHWEKIYDAPLPNRPTGAQGLLPTFQTRDLHLQVYRRRPTTP